MTVSTGFAPGLAVYAAVPAAIWGVVMVVVQTIGTYQIFRYHGAPPRKAVSPTLDKAKIPHITIIRPVKDLEPQLYECLASTFRQSYPRDKLTVYLCVADESDAAYPVLEQIVSDFSDFDVRILVEEYDPVLNDAQSPSKLGPNPKIRNMSRAYREAKGDLIWIIDCNVWVSKGVAGRMVDKLEGYLPDRRRATPYKFVHQLPLVVDVSKPVETPGSGKSMSWLRQVWAQGGGRLEEMFMATTHAKFYSAINTVSIAPCIVGKSNMFRKSHLDKYTDPGENHNLKPIDADRGRGIDFFSWNICEDHLIGDLLWRANIPGYKNHGLVSGDLAVQPMAGMSIGAYMARRSRWLRVRKYTVTLATLVEPFVESILCNIVVSFALTNIPWLHISIPAKICWILGIGTWAVVDRLVYSKLHACQSVEIDSDTPAFARGARRPGGVQEKSLSQWVPAWIGREILAFPIWFWAVLLGATVTWRKKRFRVRRDMTVVAIVDNKKTGKRPPAEQSASNVHESGMANGTATSHRPKARTVASGHEVLSARRRQQYSSDA